MLFTDIVGSTQMARATGPRWVELLETHHALVGGAIRAEGGWVEASEGDAFVATFADARAGARAALAAQRALSAHAWPQETGVVRVRMGLHVGHVERGREPGYVGLEMHRAARIGAAAHGGQVLLSASAARVTTEVLTTEPLGAHRLKDFPQPEHLFCAVIDGRGASAFPPPRADSVQATNLPAGLARLLGREEDSARVIEALMLDQERIVTLTGRSGMGKTSLALAVASEVLSSFPGGVWLVRLARVTDPTEVIAAIGAAVDSGSDPTVSALTGTARRLRDRGRTLLVLDNLEHLLDAIPELGRLMEELPDVQVLVTSQAPLRLADEICIPLGRIADDPAVALIERVTRRRNPQVSFAGGDRETVLELVNLLDGLPLALELAAARLALLSPTQLLVRLRESTDFLRDDRSDRPERQRSLRAMVDWTLALLEPGPQALFPRLGVFAGPVELEEIETVCDGDGVDALSDLFRLSEMALVRRVEDGGGRIRFGLPEGLRHVTTVRLAEVPEAAHWHERHARRQLEIIEAGRTIYATNREYDAAVDAEPERELAMQWARTEDPDLFARLAAGHAMLASERGKRREAAALLGPLLAHPPADPATRLTTLQAAMWLAGTTGDLDRALALGLKALELATDAASRAITLELVGTIRAFGGDAAGGIRDIEEALALATDLADTVRAPLILVAAQMHLAAHDLDRAAERLEEGAALAERCDSCFAWRRHTLDGELAALHGDAPAALGHYSRSLEEAELRHNDQQALFDLILCALSLAHLGHDEAAVEVRGITRALADELGGPGMAAIHVFDITAVIAAQRRLGPAEAAAATARGRAVAPAQRINHVRELNRAAVEAEAWARK